MISSIRLDGSADCLAIQGGATKEVFREYVGSVLCPALHPGDMVIADNLSAHKDARVKEPIENRGASILFLPAYSPDLNPIEKMWSKGKEKIRSLAEDAGRIRRQNGAEFFTVSRRLSFNIIKKDQSKKAGISRKRKMAARNTDYAMQLRRHFQAV